MLISRLYIGQLCGSEFNLCQTFGTLWEINISIFCICIGTHARFTAIIVPDIPLIKLSPFAMVDYLKHVDVHVR
jgi:hypothetical protein